MFLTQSQLIELTGFKRSGAQLRALRYLGLEHRQRADGSLVVLKSHVEQALGLLTADKTSNKPKKATPNWSSL